MFLFNQLPKPGWIAAAAVTFLIGLAQTSLSQAAEAKPADAPDPARIAAFAEQKCLQDVIMMSAMDGKTSAEIEVFCGCVGNRRAEYLMEKPDLVKKTHWRRETRSRAIVTCSRETKTQSSDK